MKSAALILIDVQKGFHDPIWGQRNNPEMEVQIGEVLAYWRCTGRKVIHVQHLSVRAQSPLLPGQEGVDFMPCAVPRCGERIFQKEVNSAFIGTGLEVYLRAASLSKLVFVGLTSDHCVSTSVRMAKNLGFSPFVLSDATAAFDRSSSEGNIFPADLVHAVSLASLKDEFARVLDVKSLISIIDGGGDL